MITLEQHIQKMRRLSDELLKADRPVYFAAQSTLAEFSERVFVKGQSTTGGQFQYNSSDPLYVYPDARTFGNTSSLKPPTGKTGKRVFKSTGKAHKMTWVESYKALRNLVGREDSFVNWTAQGDLKSEIENRTSDGMTPVKVGEAEYEIAVRSSENTGKLAGLNKKYPNVFRLSPSEKATYFRIFDKEFLRLLREKI